MAGRGALAGSALVVVLALAGCAGQSAAGPGGPGAPTGSVEAQPAPSSTQPAPSSQPGGGPVGQAVPPPVTEEMHAVADQLAAVAGTDPGYGGPEFSDDRTRLIVHWHGAVPPEVQAVVDAHASGPFTVVVEPMRFSFGELSDEGGRLVQDHPGVVSSAGPRPDGSGVEVMVTTAAVEEAGGLDAALAANGVVSRFPLFPGEGDAGPA
jgi:hypothetical protein